MKEFQRDTVVIGAGLTGLTAAYYLNKRNTSFAVVEKSSRPGGVIDTAREEGFLYEKGPNTGVIGNTAVVELFDELAGICTLETANESSKKRHILKNGEWHALPTGPVEAINTPLFTLHDKFRILGEPFRSPGRDQDENLSSFVRRRLGKSFLDYAIDPFILGVYAGDPDYIIPAYALPKLYNLEQKYGSLIGGSIRRKFEKKTPLEKRVNRKVFSCEGGLSNLTHALYEKADPGNFFFDASGVSVTKTGENNYSVKFIQHGEPFIVRARQVITTVGAYELESVLPFISPTDLHQVDNLLYTKVVEVSLGFNAWTGIPLDGFGGLIPSVEKRDILGILFMSALFDGRAPEGGALITAFMGGVRRPDLVEMSDAAIKETISRECRDLLKIADFQPDLFRIIRHTHAIPQYGLDSRARFNTIQRLETMHAGLLIGGNLRNGIGMADRILQGRNLAEEVSGNRLK